MGGYSKFIDSNGRFYDWFEKGKPFDDTLAGQASRQLEVAGDTPIEWRVREAKQRLRFGLIFEVLV